MLKLSKKTTSTMFVLLGTVLGTSYAQYEISKSTINSGGRTLESGQFKLSHSTAQIDASNTLENGDFMITGGFWQQNNDLIFKNGFE